ncbi:hypothetical protein EWM64_g2772 [Hericium alpestre]|uniref:Uncharacterized protein n=1 Tax=Hericium alpestre TaxID=135208 RepID=A0A4Z0A6F1_9AGAM|nr:hypothetical protein EWM64_g2772 [Hericium alpestre]
MSYPSKSSSSNDVASGQSGRYTVAPQAIQSAIATHQYKAQINKFAPPPEIAKQQMEIQEASAAYFSGKITGPEFDAICDRIQDAGRAYDKRIADLEARREAGEAKHVDWYKEIYGYTDEEAEGIIRYRQDLGDIQRANEARNRSRVLQQSRHGRGH